MLKPPARWLVIAAFAAIYLIWGSSYIGIHYAVETIPPFMMMGVRMMIAGLLLVVVARRGGAPAPTRRHWRSAGTAGLLLFVFNAGAIAYTEAWLKLPTGIVAVLLATMPLWMVLINWLRPGGTAPTALVVTGIAIGFIGIILLSLPEQGMPALNPLGVILILAAAFFWAFGSIYTRTAELPSSAPLSTGMQLVAGGVGLTIVSIVSGEAATFSPALVSLTSLAATIYLAIFSSIIGFSAFVWLLRVVNPAKVATYAYVNPVIAVLLGAILLGEPITLRSLIAGAIILFAVFLISIPRLPFAGRVRLAKAT